jgi:hypothetical protein
VAASRIQNVTAPDAGVAALTIGSGQGWAAPTAGSLLVAWYNGDNTVTLPTGFTAGPSVVDGNACYIWWKVAAGTETSVVFTQAASSDGEAGLLEYSGVAASPTDVQNSSTIAGTLGTVTTSVSVTGTGTSGDLYMALAGLHGTGTAAPTGIAWTNSFTNVAALANGTPNTATYSAAFLGEFQNTGTGAVSTAASWTNNIQNRQELLIGFKLAAAAAANPIPYLAMTRT